MSIMYASLNRVKRYTTCTNMNRVSNKMKSDINSNVKNLLYDQNHYWFDRKSGMIGMTEIGIRDLVERICRTFPFSVFNHEKNRLFTPLQHTVRKGDLVVSFPIVFSTQRNGNHI